MDSVGFGMDNVGFGMDNVGFGMDNIGFRMGNLGVGMDKFGLKMDNLGSGMQNSGDVAAGMSFGVCLTREVFIAPETSPASSSDASCPITTPPPAAGLCL